MRILIATVTAGAGHVAAAAALEEAWRAEHSEDVVERLDLVKFFSPLHRKVVSDGYVKLVERAPELWGMVFKKTDDPKLARRLSRIQRLFPSHSRSRFEKHVMHFKPDAVLCTHYSPLETLGQMKRKAARQGANRARKEHLMTVPERGAMFAPPFVVSIVTDFEAHALWMNSSVDLYCVAAEETKARLVARGATAVNIIATGIPISGRFSVNSNRDALRKSLGVRDDLPIILVLSGGFGM